MREPKYYIYLNDDEYSLLLNALISMKNELLREGRYTDAVDDIIVKVSKAKLKKVRIK